jgi:hypothetical protein
LNRRVLQSTDTMHGAVESAGGLYMVPAGADAQEVRREVIARGLCALEVHGRDIEVVRDLPLDFLVTFDVDSVESITTLRGLRGLHVDSWAGHLDFDALPRLEWFAATELVRGQLDGLLERERQKLHHLWVGRYRFADATPLAALTRLTHLAIGDSRSFTSPRGLEALSGLQHFHAYLCPKLASLDGVEAAVGLRHVCLETCNRITDLAPLARLEGLRSVQLDMRVPPALSPLIGHPALEYLCIVSAKRPEPDIVDGLLRSPRLRFLTAGRSAWLRTDGRWEHIADIYAMTERQSAMHEQVRDERVGLAAY